MKPLAGLKVLDFSKVLAGPMCAQYLGDLGADVIKIEPTIVGDETRGNPPFRAAGLGTIFLSVNRNKRSIAIDLKTDEGRSLVHRLAKSADVVIESYGTGVAERLGIDAATLQALNERLVHCSISGFGRSGPLKNSPGYDVILQAFSGMMALTGEEGGGYIRSPISPTDQVTGLHALSGILAALLARQTSGKGSTVNVSLFDSAVGMLGYNLQTYWETGGQPARCGSGQGALCPYQAFQAADGPVMIGVANDNLWRKFCAAVGLNAIVDDPKFRTNADRVRHRTETNDYVQAAIATRSVAELNETLARIGVPCSPINSLAQMLDHPHTKASGMVVEYEHPVAGHLKGVGYPVVLNDDPRAAGLPPPMLGEQTDEILSELGLPKQEIEALRQAKIVV